MKSQTQTPIQSTNPHNNTHDTCTCSTSCGAAGVAYTETLRAAQRIYENINENTSGNAISEPDSEILTFPPKPKLFHNFDPQMPTLKSFNLCTMNFLEAEACRI